MTSPFAPSISSFAPIAFITWAAFSFRATSFVLHGFIHHLETIHALLYFPLWIEGLFRSSRLGFHIKHSLILFSDFETSSLCFGILRKVSKGLAFILLVWIYSERWTFKFGAWWIQGLRTCLRASYTDFNSLFFAFSDNFLFVLERIRAPLDFKGLIFFMWNFHFVHYGMIFFSC